MPKKRTALTDSLSFYGESDPRELADKYGTPLYVYNENVLRKRCQELMRLSSWPGFTVNYSVKANSNPALLRIIKEEGLVVDAMSPGELRMDEIAGFSPSEILYISNNISPEEMLAAISRGCLVSVDSLSQLEMAGGINPGGQIMLRVNPGIGAGHSQKVITAGKATKFGISPECLPQAFEIMQKHDLSMAGINQHIGSLFMEPEKYLRAAAILLDLVCAMPGEMKKNLEIIDFGGGFGIPYHKYDNEKRLDMSALGAGLDELVRNWAQNNNYHGRFIVEPGRYVVAECGVLLGRANSVKSSYSTNYVGTDIGFNVLMRPVLYNSFHDLEVYSKSATDEEALQTIVGNICESGDILAKDRMLPKITPGDLLGVLDAGAYGFSMASSYNERLLPAEVLIQSNGRPSLIRRRQTLDDLASCLVI